jgi:dipeptidyl aminopeptidase/acylaminoacyl peptidase
MKKRYKILIISGTTLVIIGVLLCCVIIPVIGKNTMLHPDPELMYILPQELGMTYENITFSTEDDLDLKGWFIDPINTTNANANTTIIVLHGATHSKAFMLDHYGLGLYNYGYKLFFFDSRNRGESPITELGLTWGIDEKKDVRAAVDYVKGRPDVDSSKVVLFAESQGAATILFYTATYNDVAAIIADSSWAYGDLMIKQAYPMRSGFPWAIFGQITIAMMEKHYGYSFADISPADVVEDITTPTYIIHGNADLDINPDDATIIHENLPTSSSNIIWLVENRGHVEAFLEPDYFDRIAEFISNNI